MLDLFFGPTTAPHQLGTRIVSYTRASLLYRVHVCTYSKITHRFLYTFQSFVHVSTAFSNCVDRKVVEEKLYAPPVPADTLLKLVDDLDDRTLERITAR